jgi:hypothetical protein
MAIEDRRKKKSAGEPKDRRRDALDIWSDLHAGQSRDTASPGPQGATEGPHPDSRRLTVPD